MTEAMRELWTRIEAFEIDDLTRGVPDLTFAERLARENRWSVAFARRVVHEYKRFLLLAIGSGHKVTPSDEVDQAWHLHMTYTRSYWDRLCKQVLQHPLHHDPTRGGEQEDAKFDDWYARTKESYTRIFGEAPPADIWPSSKVRFDPNLRWQRLNTSAFWLLPKRRTRRRVLGTMALFGLLTAGAGFAPRFLGSIESRLDSVVIGIVILVFILWILSSIAPKGRKRGRGSSGSDNTSSGCGGWWWFGGDSGSGCSSHHGHDGGGGHGCGGHGGDSGGCGGGGDGGGGCGGGGCGGGGCGGGGCGS